jgi:hypothetical protein
MKMLKKILVATDFGPSAGDALKTAQALASAFPPPLQGDWRQADAISCKGEDCRALQTFALDPAEQVHRFRLPQDRPQHFQRQIEQHGLDMTHVTERKGSPQTPIRTKTRRTWQRQCAQHKADGSAMARLLRLPLAARGEAAKLAARMAAAKERKSQA